MDLHKEPVVYQQYGSQGGRYAFNSETGSPLATSDGNCNGGGSKRDTIVSTLRSVFLPHGYPESVSEDYLEYQLWDTAQAFCSSITGTLASYALLKGYGVGDDSASVLAAAMNYLLRDGTGMVGRIVFAWMKGVELDCDSKRWRLVADLLNDVAILLELLAPVFQQFFLLIVCVSSIFKSIVGVCGGATRAALTLHQAKRNNISDVSAKDGSQETLVNLMALLGGLIITPIVSKHPILVWPLFIIFTAGHLFSNYRAVSCVVMETVNLPRFHILLSRFIETGEILSTVEVNKLDPVVSLPGYTATLKLGASLAAFQHFPKDLPDRKHHIQFVIAPDADPAQLESATVLLHEEASTDDVYQAVFQCLLIDILVQIAESKQTRGNNHLTDSFAQVETLVQRLLSNSNNLCKVTTHLLNPVYETSDLYLRFMNGLRAKGWDLDRVHIPVDEWRVNWDLNLAKKNL